MASSLIISCKQRGKQWKQWQALFFWAPESLEIVTAAMKLKDALWKKSYDKPIQCSKKQKHYFADKGLDSQSYGFSVVMHGCESWTIKKGECRQIDAFELCCWRRHLRVPWTARRSNWSILKEIDPAYSLEVLIWSTNTLATWWKEPTLWKWPWCWERLKAREGDGRGDGWITSLTQWTWVWASSGRWWWTGNPGMLQTMGLQRVRHWSDWTTTATNSSVVQYGSR